ncbi:hypothetical protein ZYGM_002829 [Zygosaccharomyces mellis]|uniref:Uncharacterized protein n=1 Tax=Zygosaccharomyces mellis TaxID=42258 RepID=A0A4C2E8G1_9SACH|nr:hypothetical protein ZYGM_002829 [Zygosaccharomyces mellis]
MYTFSFVVLWFLILRIVFSHPVVRNREPVTHVLHFEATSRNNFQGRRIIAISDYEEYYDKTFGPPIRVHAGDTINLSLKNSICSEEEVHLGENDKVWKDYCDTGLHFHGLVPIGNHVDGVPGLTQPPIRTGDTFWYNFTVPEDVCGTYWYHSHSTIQYGDGLRGTLVVECDEYDLLVNRVVQSLRQRAADNGLLDIPPTAETTEQQGIQEEFVTLSDWYEDWNLDVARDKMMFPGGTTDPHIDGSLINGSENDQLEINLNPDTEAVVLRLVNSGMAGTQIIHAEGKHMVVIETDGILVKPYAIDTLSLAVGQRYTVIIYVDEEPIKLINGCNKMMGYITKVFWLAKSSPTRELGFDGNIKNLPGFYRGELYKELEPLPFNNSGGINILGSREKEDDIQRITLDYLYVRDNDEITQKYGTEMYTVNGKTLQEYMESPIEVAGGKILEIIINALDHMRHPWHMHGHHFQVVSLGEKRDGALRLNGEDDDTEINDAEKRYNDDLKYWTESGKTPMTRDSINIEGGSFAVVRIETNMPGNWLLHCHVEWHVAKGLGVVIRELPEPSKQLQEQSPWEQVNTTSLQINSNSTINEPFPTSKIRVLSIYTMIMSVLDLILYWIII